MRSWLEKVVVVMVLVPSIAAGIWYAVFFLPHLHNLKTIAKQGQEAINGIEATLYPLAVVAETKKGIRSWAIRQAYSTLVSQKNRGSTFSWHLNNGLWHAASYLHFNEREIFSIWAVCSLHGCGHGLKEAAQKLFGKDLKSLSERELASLVAMVKNPSRFVPGTEAGNQRTTEILEQKRLRDLNDGKGRSPNRNSVSELVAREAKR